jgi:hypothetical protein
MKALREIIQVTRNPKRPPPGSLVVGHATIRHNMFASNVLAGVAVSNGYLSLLLLSLHLN